MADDKKSNDKNFKALVEEQKRTNIALNKLAGIEEEQKKGTTALNKLAGITEQQGPPPPPDNSDIVGGLEELGEKITGGTKELSESDQKRAAEKKKNQRELESRLLVNDKKNFKISIAKFFFKNL